MKYIETNKNNMQGVTTLHVRRNFLQQFFLEEVLILRSIFLALQGEIGGIFLSYTVVHGIPGVWDALAKSTHEFSQASQSRKVLTTRTLLI